MLFKHGAVFSAVPLSAAPADDGGGGDDDGERLCDPYGLRSRRLLRRRWRSRIRTAPSRASTRRVPDSCSASSTATARRAASSRSSSPNACQPCSTTTASPTRTRRCARRSSRATRRSRSDAEPGAHLAWRSPSSSASPASPPSATRAPTPCSSRRSTRPTSRGAREIAEQATPSPPAAAARASSSATLDARAVDVALLGEHRAPIGVTCEPSLVDHEVSPLDKFVPAPDGVWDMVAAQEAVEIVAKERHATRGARAHTRGGAPVGGARRLPRRHHRRRRDPRRGGGRRRRRGPRAARRGASRGG